MHDPINRGRLWLFSATAALLFQSFKLREDSSNSALQRQAARQLSAHFPQVLQHCWSRCARSLTGKSADFQFLFGFLSVRQWKHGLYKKKLYPMHWKMPSRPQKSCDQPPWIFLQCKNLFEAFFACQLQCYWWGIWSHLKNVCNACEVIVQCF